LNNFNKRKDNVFNYLTNVKEISDDNKYDEEINNSEVPLIADFHNNGYGDKSCDIDNTISDYIQRLIDINSIEGKNSNNTGKNVKFTSVGNEENHNIDKNNKQNNSNYIRKHKHQLIKSSVLSKISISSSLNTSNNDIKNLKNTTSNYNNDTNKNIKKNDDNNKDGKNNISNTNKSMMLYEPHPPQEKHQLFRSKSDNQKQNDSNIKTSFIRHHAFVSPLNNNNSPKSITESNLPNKPLDKVVASSMKSVANDEKANLSNNENKNLEKNNDINEGNKIINNKTKEKNEDNNTMIIKMNNKTKKSKKKNQELNNEDNEVEKDKEDEEDDEEVVEFFNKLNDPEKRKSIKNFVISFDSDSSDNDIEDKSLTKEELSNNDYNDNQNISEKSKINNSSENNVLEGNKECV